MRLKDAVAKMTLVSMACLGLFVVLPGVVLGWDLNPPGPPAPTMRTLESLGFDCPNDAAGTTNLLYTFVTDSAGFDTGTSISNTASDLFGTVGQTGTCTLNFYGANAPVPVTTGAIPPGTTYTFLASSIAPNFQG
jgi:hypothetical protein